MTQLFYCCTQPLPGIATACRGCDDSMARTILVPRGWGRSRDQTMAACKAPISLTVRLKFVFNTSLSVSGCCSPCMTLTKLRIRSGSELGHPNQPDNLSHASSVAQLAELAAIRPLQHLRSHALAAPAHQGAMTMAALREQLSLALEDAGTARENHLHAHRQLQVSCTQLH